jgi:hypothetical protein
VLLDNAFALIDGIPNHKPSDEAAPPAARKSNPVEERRPTRLISLDLRPGPIAAPRVSRRPEEAALLDRDRDLGGVLDCTAIRVARHRNRIVQRSLI